MRPGAILDGPCSSANDRGIWQLGSDVTHEHRGMHLLKGIDGDQQLLAVARP
jgi:hypothetical protein